MRTAAVFLAGWTTFINLYTPQAILPSLASDLGASGASVGLSLTAPLIAVSMMAPVAGAISDRLGRKRLIVTAMTCLVLPTILVATSADLTQLLIWRFLQGLMLPFIFTVTVAYIADECPGMEAIKVSGMYSAGSICGGFSGRFIAGIMADLAGWRWGFVSIGLLTFCAALFVLYAMPRERSFRPLVGKLGATFAAYRAHLGNPRLLATCFVAFGMLFATVAIFTFVNLQLSMPPYSLSQSQLGTMFAVYLAGMVATPLGTRAAVAIGRWRAGLLAIATAAAGTLLTLDPWLPAVIIGLAMVCIGLFTTQALGIGFIGVVAHRARSSAVGLYVTIYYTGGAMGGLAPGWVWHHAGWGGVVALCVAVMGGMTLLVLSAWTLPPPAQNHPA